MSKTDYSTKSRKFHHLTEIQRGEIQAMMKLKVPKVQIALKVGLSDKWSPDSVLGYAKHKLFEIMICTNTLYNYIEKSLIKVKNIDLAQKVRRKLKKKGIREYRKKLGQSIELRAKFVDDREEFGCRYTLLTLMLLGKEGRMRKRDE